MQPPTPTSFATSLFSSPISIKSRTLLSKHLLDDLIRLLKSRITLEETYSRGLSKLSNPISSLPSNSTLTSAITGFTSDILNKSYQHLTLSENLSVDLLLPLQSLRDDVQLKLKNYEVTVKEIVTRLGRIEGVYKKSWRGYDRAYREAEAHCISLGTTDPELVLSLKEKVMEAIVENSKNLIEPEGKSLKKSAMHSLGLPSPSKDLVNWLLPSSDQKKNTTIETTVSSLLSLEIARKKCLREWKEVGREHGRGVIEWQVLVNEMQGMEERVIFEVQDMLRKHIVLESSCFANLQYDIQMLFGVMESVSVEDDVAGFIETVEEEERSKREEREEEERREWEGVNKVLHEDSEDLPPPPTSTSEKDSSTPEIDHTVGIPNLSSLVSKSNPEILPPKTLTTLHKSLFNSISTSLPPPPPSNIVDIPVNVGSDLPVDSSEVSRFWDWRGRSFEHFRGLKIEKEEEDGEEGEEEEKPKKCRRLFLASEVGDILEGVMENLRLEEEKMEKMEKEEEEKKKEEEKKRAAADPPKSSSNITSTTSSSPSSPLSDFGSIPSLPTASKPSAPNPKPPNSPKPVNKRQFPSVTALQSKEQTILLFTVVQHHLKVEGGERGEVDGLDLALGEIASSFNTLFFARQAMDSLLRRCDLHTQPHNTPIIVQPSHLLKAYLSFSRMLNLILQSPNDPVSAPLFRDILLVSCFVSCPASSILSQITKHPDSTGNLTYISLKKHIQNLISSKTVGVDDTCFLRQVLGAEEVFKGKQVMPLEGVFVASTLGECDDSKLPEHLLKVKEGVEGEAEEEIVVESEANIVVGQIVFMSWLLFGCGLTGVAIKKGIKSALSSLPGRYSGVETIISTSLELSNSMRVRVSSGMFNSSGGEKYGSTGGVKQPWEKADEEDGGNVVDDFIKSLEKNKIEGGGGGNDFGF
ncbi:hypothetical protein TrLO_g9973 [Triparma laevis f. longispina]|uniref:FCH domain-containing protein n=1 Tax=Triparma laevis f. longispina TaxID=1714387 RepID=A0A9W7EFG8_9STRA|nr:hypothetical protein TrLO_g9973 [Triparma laevis f. longispina]